MAYIYIVSRNLQAKYNIFLLISEHELKADHNSELQNAHQGETVKLRRESKLLISCNKLSSQRDRRRSVRKRLPSRPLASVSVF